MKKSRLYFVLCILFLSSFNAISQEVAMDFTQNECEGSSHHLYSELNAGKVVILEFVMLNCAPCIVGTKALENITTPYETSHPGRVNIYSFGFLNSYTCDQLLAWKGNNEFTHPVFNNGEEQVNYYGGMGMPTIVVTGTNDYKVFFKSIGYTSSMDKEIKAAIDSALLYNPTAVGEQIASDRFKVYPTVFSDQLTIETQPGLAGSEVVICDISGREVISNVVPASGHMVIATAGLIKGVYFLRFKGLQGFSDGIKLIRQ